VSLRPDLVSFGEKKISFPLPAFETRTVLPTYYADYAIFSPKAPQPPVGQDVIVEAFTIILRHMTVGRTQLYE
jgi:hypothetical protein